MTRIFEIESDEFQRIEKREQSFVVLKNDKMGIKAGDKLILQDIPEGEEGGVSEVSMLVDFFMTEYIKTGYVLCALKEPTF